MQEIKIRGMVLFEKFFDARCRTLLLVSLPGRSDKGAERQAERFMLSG